MSGFCVDCGWHVDSFDGLEVCPQCGSKGVPCADEYQIKASVNWHELRILCIWAERWAHQHAGGAGTVYAIAGRLMTQFPALPSLTLAGEVREIQDYFGRDQVETNIPGVE